MRNEKFAFRRIDARRVGADQRHAFLCEAPDERRGKRSEVGRPGSRPLGARLEKNACGKRVRRECFRTDRVGRSLMREIDDERAADECLKPQRGDVVRAAVEVERRIRMSAVVGRQGDFRDIRARAFLKP